MCDGSCEATHPSHVSYLGQQCGEAHSDRCALCEYLYYMGWMAVGNPQTGLNQIRHPWLAMNAIVRRLHQGMPIPPREVSSLIVCEGALVYH